MKYAAKVIKYALIIAPTVIKINVVDFALRIKEFKYGTYRGENMMKKGVSDIYDIVVVGGGIAGLTAAAFGVKQNQKVLLCEKQAEIGGLVSGFWHDGFYFDAGIRALENAGTLLPMLRELNIKAELKKSDVRIRIADQTVLISSQNGLDEYQKMLNTLFPCEENNINKIVDIINKTVDEMNVLYGVENPLFSPLWGQPLKLMCSMMPWIGGYLKTVFRINQAKISVRKKLMTITDSHSLIDMIIQHFFTDSPTFFALGYFYLYKDYYYPEESILGIVKSLKRYIEHGNGRVMFNTSVSKIDKDQKIITDTTGKTIKYKKLIWCCSEKLFHKAIDSHINFNNTQRGSDSILNIYIATKTTSGLMQQLTGSHMFYTKLTDGLSSLGTANNLSDEEELFTYVKNYLKLTTYEISCPTVHNNTLAPQGHCTLTVGTIFSYDLTKQIKNQGLYDKFIELCTNEIINLLNEELIPGLKSSVVFTRCATPITIEKTTGNDDGAITGWSHTCKPTMAVTEFMGIAKSIKTGYPDIYRAGMWSFSPAGLPVSIITGRLAADKACR